MAHPLASEGATALLTKKVFVEGLLSEVAGFDCGDAPWEAEAAEWIKQPCTDIDGALGDISRRGTRVWLYYDKDEILVGFASLATSKWADLPPDGKRAKVSIIPWVAIQRCFWGRGDSDGRYSEQIIGDLISEARMQEECEPILGLYVHPDNERAVAFYERIGFEFIARSYDEYRAMILRI